MKKVCFFLRVLGEGHRPAEGVCISFKEGSAFGFSSGWCAAASLSSTHFLNLSLRRSSSSQNPLALISSKELAIAMQSTEVRGTFVVSEGLDFLV